MIQMPSRIAMTFQSTYLNASASVMMPSQHMTATPTSAASVLSTTLVITARIVRANTISVSHCIGSMGFSLKGMVVESARRRGSRLLHGGRRGRRIAALGRRVPAHDRQQHEKADHVRNGHVPSVIDPAADVLRVGVHIGKRDAGRRSEPD